MQKNEILEEIWQTRKEIEDQEGGDLKRVFEKMKKKISESNRKHYFGTIRTLEAFGNTWPTEYAASCLISSNGGELSGTSHSIVGFFCTRTFKRPV